MKRLLNTLYIMSAGSFLSRKGDTVNVSVEHETKYNIPIHNLDGIVCLGNVMCTPALMGMCGDNGVAISFLTENGRFLARVQGAVSGNVLLRREQYRRADSETHTAALARNFVLAKAANCRTVLLRAGRDRPQAPDIDKIRSAADTLKRHIDTLQHCSSVDEIRGYEGLVAKAYFGVFDHLVCAQKEAFTFRERSRRPPLDNMNALLSFVYTVLAHDVRSALESVGLDPAVGFLHRDRPGRPGLALDLMEELRPLVADRLALSLINLQQVRDTGFSKTESGAVVMDDKTRKTVLVAYQKRKQEQIRHPFLDEQIALGLVPFAQSLLLARHIRGDLDGYPPYFAR